MTSRTGSSLIVEPYVAPWAADTVVRARPNINPGGMGMRLPVKSESDAFFLTFAVVLVVFGAVLLGALVAPVAGVIALGVAALAAIVWQLGRKETDRETLQDVRARVGARRSSPHPRDRQPDHRRRGAAPRDRGARAPRRDRPSRRPGSYRPGALLRLRHRPRGTPRPRAGSTRCCAGCADQRATPAAAWAT